MRSTPASAWCTSTSGWWSRSPSPRTSCSATTARGPLVLRARACDRATVAELGERYGLAVDPRARIWQLSVGEQQRVEILKALYREARILIMDEPTAVLTPQEAVSLFATLRAMAEEGKTVIFISHKLHEVQAVADRVTVLRGGRTVETVDAADATPRSLAALMVGREIERRAPLERARQLADVRALEVDGSDGRGRSRRDRGRRTSRSRSARARSSASPGSRETGSASWPRRSPACVTSAAGSIRVGGRACEAAIRARRSSRASRTFPRIGSGRGSPRA